MKNFFRKKDTNIEEPADFVLFGRDDEDYTDTTAKQVDNFDDTADFDVSEIVSALEKQNKNSAPSNLAQKITSAILNKKNNIK